MERFRLCIFVLLAALSVMLIGDVDRVAGEDPALRTKAAQQMKDGNWKDAYESFSQLALDPADNPLLVGDDLNDALTCLGRLGRVEEVDAFREKVITTHAGNWRLLHTAAQSYLNTVHNGFIIAGNFSRGGHRGGGKAVNAYERDRVRALQLMQQASEVATRDRDADALGQFYLSFAEMLLGNRGWSEAWRLQYLTDLTVLPDYDEGYWYGGRNPQRGAPVDENGTPVYYSVPKSWQDARNDGERWRWAQQRAVDLSPGLAASVKWGFAQFLQAQFGPQTMAQYDWYFRGQTTDDSKGNESGPYALFTLGDDETIARLATGIKRFKLPDEFNYHKIYQQLADGVTLAEEALDALAGEYETRRQYDRAADYWQQAIKRFGAGHDHFREQRLAQIIRNWGQFEPVMTQPAGQGATVEFRFRNGTHLDLTAQQIDVKRLLDDVKAYLKSNPRQLDWQQMDIRNIGWRLVMQNQDKYLVKQVAQWELDLQPRPHHFDKRITITTPLQKAGAYLLTAKMADGNTSRIVLWVADTAIVKKMLDQQNYYFVADAVSGKPIPRANLEYFGYRQDWKREGNGGHYDITTRNFAEFTDADGQLFLKPGQQDQNYQWVIVATQGERMAYLGFTGAWCGNYYDEQYNATKTFVITDRPVYRPAQPVKFKCWINHAQYDQEGNSAFAGRQFLVRIDNPKGEKVFENTFTADEYGGLQGEFTLEKDATLGTYQLSFPKGEGNGSFRVEEYKKPEFEVTVVAPEKPVMLGETITATIKANYYFGAPVTDAKVKYKILRSNYSANWYPVAYWDWFYGAGYWWYACDYPWYPGWRDWGCRRPVPFWWGYQRQQQPELVAEVEAPIGPDGTVKVEIDTAIAKAIQGDTDHRYEITAEVTDQSRRTIVGQGAVLVARKPFKVYAWVDRGYYRVGDVIQADFNAQTLDNQPVQGKGELRLLKISYPRQNGQGQPVETEVQRWDLPTGDDGRAHLQMKAERAGQYRLSYKVTDAANHAIEGGYVFTVMGEGVNGSQFRFNDLELITDKREYRPGEQVKLQVNTNRPDATVLLFVRPANGIGLPPKILRMDGKSAVEQIEVRKKDMPNFFVEAVTVSGGKVYSETREIVVPPEQRVLNVKVTPSAATYKPGAKATLKVTLTEPNGEPYRGTTVVSIYDKAVEYISGGSNVPAIKEFYWKWRRSHYPRTESSLDKGSSNLNKSGEIGMGFLGLFGREVADEILKEDSDKAFLTDNELADRNSEVGGMSRRAMKAAGPAGPPAAPSADLRAGRLEAQAPADAAPAGPVVEPTVRSNFADTAYWNALVQTDEKGQAEIELTMPENLTTWKAKVWAMGQGTRVGEGTAEMITTKNLIIRLQAPRFFVQKDEVVLSANVHNYLKTRKTAKVLLEMDGGCLAPLAGVLSTQTITVEANGEKRVDWRVKVLQPGEAKIRMKALTDEESDAMAMSFPVFVHGMLKTESFSGVIRPDKTSATVKIRVPAERRPEQSRLEVRYSPTLAGAMVDALPYLAEYPYGCTEQTLNRFLPAVITQKVLLNMGLNLKDIRDKRTNLNAQEIGDDVTRAQDWRRMEANWRGERNPVFDEAEVRSMVKAGLERLAAMQCQDGGWGWFSGWGECSYPHTTALVVHGMQIARQNDVALVPGVLERGVDWLKRYQANRIAELQAHPTWEANALDAFVYMVLVDEKSDNKEMRTFLYRDRNDLPVYAKSMFGIALHRVGDVEKRDMVIRNIEQYLVQDDENQTAYLRLPENNWWWCWYGSEYEAQAYYLKLLTVTDPKSEKASRLVKYLMNNRKHATYWNSTRDTAVVIEAFADYMKASGEDKPNMTVALRVDGKQVKEVKINTANLFSFDNKLVLEGDAVTTGEHVIELVKQGTGPLYFNAYLTNFTLEDPITKAGLEIKVNRTFYKLVRVDKTIKTAGMRGQAVDQRVEKYERRELKDLATLKSGDLVEVELEIDSKNDYEYILFEDMKAAGFEPVEVRSGYNSNDMGAYMELHDERVCFFVRQLARGKHSVSYRLRAEIPGQFSALPTKASAMYAPELKANSDEIKLRIED